MASIKAVAGKNGTYYKIIVTDGYGEDGRQYRKATQYHPDPGLTAAEIQRELNLYANQFEIDVKQQHDAERIKGAPKNKGKQLFRDYANAYLEDWGKKRRIKQLTVENYRGYLTGRTDKALGDKPIGCITTQDVENYLNTLYLKGVREKGHSATPKATLYPIMKEKGFTQKSLAEAAGLCEDTVSLVTKKQPKKPLDDSKVSLGTAKKLAAALDVRVESLFIIEKDMRPLSDKSIFETYKILSLVFNYAHNKGHISANPMTAVDRPYFRRTKVESWTYEELKRLADAIKALPKEQLNWRVLITLLIATAGRRGEIAGLQWQHIDFENNVVIIEQNLLYSNENGLYIGTTKTNDYRFIKLADEVITLLKEYRQWYTEIRRTYITTDGDDLWRNPDLIRNKKTAHSFPPPAVSNNTNDCVSNEDFLFVQNGGFPIHPDSINSWLRSFTKANQLPHLTPHIIRHTIATVLFSDPEHDLRDISMLLGHSSTIVTETVYVDRRKAADARAARAMINPLAL